MYKLISECTEHIFEERLNVLEEKGYVCIQFQAFLNHEGREEFTAIMHKENKKENE